MGVMGGIQSLMGANSAKAQAGAARLQHQEQEFMRQRENARQNRNIAKQNAARWMQNKMMAKALNAKRAETEFYNRINYDNQTEAFGRNHLMALDTVKSGLYSRNIKGKTARAVLQAANMGAKEASVGQRLNYESRMRSAERMQQQGLAKRDFGYNASVPFFPNTFRGPSESSAFNMALGQGIMSTAGSMLSFGAQGGNLEAGALFSGAPLFKGN